MKKTFLTLLMVSVFFAIFAQKPYMVVFYNLENFFDTINDPETRDDEFTPDGSRKWNTVKYNKKLNNMERVLFDIASVQKTYPAVIGVSEIETRGVLEDIVSTPKLAPANYRIVHYDSPDRRGIDVGFLYRPDIFKLEGSAEIPFKMPGQPNFLTRGFVTMWGTIDDEPFFFLVSHWPSRLGGKEASSPKREAAGRAIRMIKDSVLRNNPSTKVVIMGDLNDDATDKSIVDPDCLGAKAKVKDLQTGDFYNPFIDVLKAGMGTLAYQDSWNLFDNIIVSENLVNDKEGLRLKKSDGSKYNGYIFRRPYMVQQSGQYRGYPLRTFVGTNFQDGFSDHFPVYIYIGKQTTK